MNKKIPDVFIAAHSHLNWVVLPEEPETATFALMTQFDLEIKELTLFAKVLFEDGSFAGLLRTSRTKAGLSFWAYSDFPMVRVIKLDEEGAQPFKIGHQSYGQNWRIANVQPFPTHLLGI